MVTAFQGEGEALSPNPVRLWGAKWASDQRVRPGADMVTNQMVGGARSEFAYDLQSVSRIGRYDLPLEP